MIYVNSGFPKSGTTLFQVYMEELLTVSSKSAQAIVRSYFPNSYVHHIGIINALKLIYLNIKYGNIVVKTHQGPGIILKWLISSGLAKAMYSYRDPRDMVLSALDHADAARQKKEPTQADKAFIKFNTADDLLPYVKQHYLIYLQWKKIVPHNCIRYEELIINRDETATTLEKIMELKMNNRFNLHKRVSENPLSIRHFNTGRIKRYMDLNEAERTKLTCTLQDVIIGMNYTL